MLIYRRRLFFRSYLKPISFPILVSVMTHRRRAKALKNMLVGVRRTTQKWISLAFLGLVDTPHKVANVMGALSPKQRDFRRSTSRRPPKGPKPQQPYRHLMGGKPLVPKRKGKFNFASSSVPPTNIFLSALALLLCVIALTKIGNNISL
jgi:hypothetical protein